MPTPQIRAGELRHRLDIQYPSESRDSFGAVNKTWQTESTRWGKVEPIRGTETTIAAQTTARVTHLVTMRDYTGLTPLHRIRWMDRNVERLFGIVYTVNTGERRVENVLQVKEIV